MKNYLQFLESRVIVVVLFVCLSVYLLVFSGKYFIYSPLTC